MASLLSSAHSRDGACMAHGRLIGCSSIPTVGFNMKKVTQGHVTLRWYAVLLCNDS